MSYRIFVRSWYKPDGKTPNLGSRGRTVQYVETVQEAAAFCRKHNADRPVSWLKVSRKYEFEST